MTNMHPGGPSHKMARICTIMTDDFALVRDGARVQTIARLMLERGLAFVFVTDATDAVVGYVSMVELAAHGFSRDQPAGEAFHLDSRDPTTAREIMCTSVMTLHQATSIKNAAALFAFTRAEQALVASQKQRALATVSPLDVLRWLAGKPTDNLQECEASRWRTSCGVEK